ncbi:unnamed protein product, partial [Meganyctiphanes norvegica]
FQMANGYAPPTFSVWDYAVFSVMLAGSVAIGVFHACRGAKDADDYLLGGRHMKVLPVAISLFASFMSAIGILGFSGETYGHGLEAMWQLAGAVFGITMVSLVLIPVLHPLRLTSITQYLGLRYRSNGLRRLAMLLLVVQGLLYMGLCLYAPTVALTSITPIDVNIYLIVLGIICTIYSTLGGIKAVVWVDVFQIVIMISGVGSVIGVSVWEVGGVRQAWEIAEQHNRTRNINLNVDIYERHNLLNLLLQGSVFWGSTFGVTQANFQRIASVPTKAKAMGVMGLTVIFLGTIGIFLFLSGVSVFAVYATCSPLSLGHIKSKDQILPYFVMDRMSYLPGIPGLFIAAIFSGALSSISSSLNGVVAMVWKDVLQPLPRFRRTSRETETKINKILSVVVGLMMIGLAYLCSLLEGLMQAATTVNGVTAGPILGLFLMAILMPWTNRIGAWTGLIISWVLMAWVAVGSFIHGDKPVLLPMSTEGCVGLNNSMVVSTNTSSAIMLDDVTKSWVERRIYGLSYCMLQVLGAALCIIIGVLTSLATGGENTPKVSHSLIHPIARYWLPPPNSPMTMRTRL